MAFRDPELAREIGTASRTAFSRIVDLCIDEAVGFLLIAGDLWDGDYSSTKTPRFLKQELLRLHGAGIGCFVIRGNHDALARQTGELDPPENTTVFGGRASTSEIEIDGHRIAIHGLSFREAHAPESLLPRYPAPVPGAFNIGMLHTSLNGSPGHDNYAPCSAADLAAQGYDYWALGHIHRRTEYPGPPVVVMPGTPQGRDIGEAGECSVTLVTVGDDNATTLERRSVAPIRFDRLTLDCDAVTEWPDLLTLLETGIRGAAQATRPEDRLVIRPVLTGSTPLAWRLARDLDRLTEEARAFATDAGIWIDKLELGLLPAGPTQYGAQLPQDLVDLVLNELPGDAGVRAAITAAAEELSRDLPPELRDILGQNEADMTGICLDLLARGTPVILSGLAEETAD